MHSLNHFAVVRVTQKCIVFLCVCLCVVELHVILHYIIIPSFAKKCFYGKFMSPATIQSVRKIV
jgi:hypothetical protein